MGIRCPSISAFGVSAATESMTMMSIASERMRLSAISRACSPLSGCEPTRIKEYLTIPSLTLRKQRINELLTLLLTHEMNEIDQNFYNYIGQVTEEEHPYGVNWTEYDALSPKGSEALNHE